MLRNQLTQKQLQRLSPQQIQLMKLLQIPTASIEQRIQEELEINPALEDFSEMNIAEEYITEPTREEYSDRQESTDNYEEYTSVDTEEEYREGSSDFEDNLSDYLDQDDSSYKSSDEFSYTNEEDTKHKELQDENSFYENLKEQLGLLSLSDREQIIAEQIIGSLTEDGYLERDPLSLVDDLLFTQNFDTTEEEVIAVLKKVQTLEPVGIAAKDLQECLLLQLERNIRVNASKLSQDELLILRLSRIILTDYFDEFTRKHYPRLLQQLSIDRDDLRAASDEILKLNPKPGAVYATGNKLVQQVIIPDFIVTTTLSENNDKSKDADLLEVMLNGRNAPDLRINSQYKEMLRNFVNNKKDKSHKEAADFVRQKIESAQWFIEAIRQRQITLLNTMYAITQYQEDYFLTGDERKLKPMILKDIADITGFDISTISRLVNSKYVQTEYGIKLLADFFTQGIHNEEGEEVSTSEVKKILSDIITSENSNKPYSDEELRLALEKKGFSIARRTVAKYREQLNFPVARLRKGI